MKPEDIAKAGTEHAHQAALFCWAAQNREQYPELKWMFAIPNGGERQVATAARLKAEGVRAGVADIFLPSASARFGEGGATVLYGLFIEMKKPGEKGKAAGRQSEKQVEFEEHVTEQGYLYKVCWTWEEARDVIVEYLRA